MPGFFWGLCWGVRIRLRCGINLGGANGRFRISRLGRIGIGVRPANRPADAEKRGHEKRQRHHRILRHRPHRDAGRRKCFQNFSHHRTLISRRHARRISESHVSAANRHHVECGSLLPLFSGGACLARSEALTKCEEHAPASRAGAQRRQAAALHMNACHFRYCANTLASYTILPPTSVSTDSVFGSSGRGTLKISCDSTARSASLPGSRLPFSFS